MTAPILQVDLERLVPSRLLIQGSSGAGKSYLLRYLLEQTHGQIQQFIIDPEGEFSTLREHRDYVVASAGDDGDVPAHPDSAALLCRQLVELEASAILDIYELEPEEREEFVAAFLAQLISMPKDQWRPALVVVDEAHEFAPEQGRPASRRPMELIVSKGRKRGLCAIYSTQRLSKLSKNASDLQNILVGYTGLDVDVRRAADILGLRGSDADQLKQLQHEFLAFGPAFSREVARVRSGPVQSHHPEPGEIQPPTPPPSGKLAALVAELAAIPERAQEEERSIEALEAKVSELRVQLRMAKVPRGITPEEAEAVAEERARAAVLALRSEVRPHVEALHHALANGHVKISGQDLNTPVSAPLPRHDPPAPKVASGTRGDGRKLSGPHRRILGALAWLEAIGITPADTTAVAFLAGYRVGGAFNNPRGALRRMGLLDYPTSGTMALTDEGRAVAEAPDIPHRLSDFHELVMGKLAGPHQRILQPLLECYPEDMAVEDLAEAAGYAVGGAFNNPRGRLRTMGLIDYPAQGRVVATSVLFPEGLV